MEDRYLFRGKDIDNGCWRYGNVQQVRDRVYILDYDIGDNGIDDSQVLINIAYEVIPEAVGQCTGLKDKNGKMIYEGDILYWETYPTQYGFAKAKGIPVKFIAE